MRSRRSGPVILLALSLGACAIAGPPAPSMATLSVSATSAAVAAGGSADRPAGGGGPERLAAPVWVRPGQPSLSPRYELAVVDDPCTDRDLPASMDDPVRAVLDRSYALPASYAPDDLVPASGAGFTGPSAAKLVREVVLDDLDAMRAAWEAAGLTIAIDSAYRSHGDQAATFDAWVTRIGLDQAVRRTARPGHSEHQLGTAIDVSSPGWAGRFGDWARESDEGAWMAEHAWEYGFVMSYPAGGEEASCFGYEPWHYRWIGRDAAAEQHESGLVLRQYLVRHAGG